MAVTSSHGTLRVPTVLLAAALPLAIGCSKAAAGAARTSAADGQAGDPCTNGFEQRSSAALRNELPNAVDPCKPGQLLAARQIASWSGRLLLASAELCQERKAGIRHEASLRPELSELSGRMSRVLTLLREANAKGRGEERALAFHAAWRHATPRTERKELELSVATLAKQPGEGDYHVLRDGEELRTGATVKLVARLSSPAHVYLYQLKSEGAVETLFPDARIGLRNPIGPGEPVTIPPGDSSFRVTAEHLGRESMLVVASLRPLPSLEAAIPPACAGTRDEQHVVRGLAMPAAPPSAALALHVMSDAADDTVVGILHFEHPE